MKKVIAILMVVLFIAGCASREPVQKSNLTPGMAKTKIIKGRTNQSEILRVFGAPNIITRNKSDNEVWTYDKVSIERSASSSYGTIIIAAISSSRRATSSRTFTLMIEFDRDEIVKDYSYRSSAF